MAAHSSRRGANLFGPVFLVLAVLAQGCSSNRPPTLISDLSTFVVDEGTQVGTVVHTVKASDPEGSPIIFGLHGSNEFSIDPSTGDIRVAKNLDRETSDTIRFTITVADDVGSSSGGHQDGGNNVVQVPVTVILSDRNDNAPDFKDAPYDFVVSEDTPVGTTVFRGIRVHDMDLLGEPITVKCEDGDGGAAKGSGGCSKFEVVAIESLSDDEEIEDSLAESQRNFHGAIVLKQPLDYAERQFYQLNLVASDGLQESRAAAEVRVEDVQNRPPVFVGSLTGVVKEDDPVGTLVMTLNARDGDSGHSRKVLYELVTNPHNYFLLDPETGELRTAQPLDKEALEDSTGVLTLTVRAKELVNGQPMDSPLTTTTTEATVTIRDVNDEPPRFNGREYYASVPEGAPEGTPLANLNITVHDPDVGTNSVFRLRLQDVSGSFTVEPTVASGSASVSIRVASNASLDYEDPSQRKFILLVIAEEEHTSPKLSSTATVTVSVIDENDNTPSFVHDDLSFSASVLETASPGSPVATLTAEDRDSGRFGHAGIVYQLFGNGADRFTVNNKTGVITVAECATPGSGECLDYETTPAYFLSYKATDDEGHGKSSVVSLKVALLDANDNPPRFVQDSYRAVIDEGSSRFEPHLFVKAEDPDKTSDITYSIAGGNTHNLFSVDPHTGEIRVANPQGLNMTKVSGDLVVLTLEATDGLFTNTTNVRIAVRDVNNNAPVFDKESYVADVQEDAPIGTTVDQAFATDEDSGINANLGYRIQKGSFDDFSIDEKTGILTVSNKLDYDRRNVYTIEVIAADKGTPALTGTTTITVNILNSNDKMPYFKPATQKAEVSEDAQPGTVFYTLVAEDPDVNSTDALNYAISEPITAFDKDGKQIHDIEKVKEFFIVNPLNGKVSVAQQLRREIASVVRLTVMVRDVSAPTVQEGRGTLAITVIDVNDSPPSFPHPWTPENPMLPPVSLPEELPVGTVVASYEATDQDSKISRYALEPPSEYFDIDESTGIVKTKKRIDYEEVKTLNFSVIAYDSGVPQFSATANVLVNVVNVNDMDPVFSEPEYHATINENSPLGTLVITVNATDGDDGDFGKVKYSLLGEHQEDFTILESGEIQVQNSGVLDRENTPELVIQVVASDEAPVEARRSITVPVRIKLLDMNDNPPVFNEHLYQASILENIPLSPPTPIKQVQAQDADEGINSLVMYSIIFGNEGGLFRIDPLSGIVYPARSLLGQGGQYHLTVQGRDKNGTGEYADTVNVNITVLDVNQNKPIFIMPESGNATVEVPENAGLANYLVMTVKARDSDPGENGRISYHLKVGNENTQETNEFVISADTGELRTKIILDREVKSKYELVLVAQDHGSPISYETLRFLTILLVDSDDNKPEFPMDETTMPYRFKVPENEYRDWPIGRVVAIDRDEGKYAKIYYYIIAGNEEGLFYIDRTEGILYANTTFDREKRDSYDVYIKASNDPVYNIYAPENEYFPGAGERESSVAHVHVTVQDKNDNAPVFDRSDYYAGINAMANINEFVAKLRAVDPDKGENGSITFLILTSNLYRYGSNVSSGSVVPSPFNITSDGRLVTANYVTEYNQDRFVLDVVARETAPPERETHAKVHIWIYEPEQLIRVILSRPPEEVNQEKDEIVSELSNATQSQVVIDDIRYHVDSSGQIRRDWCDMYLHVVDGKTQNIAPIPDVLKVIDAKYDFLKDKYAGFAIENVVPAFVGIREESFDPALAALIALVIVLFVGLITFLVVCCCLRHWVITSPSDLKKKEALIKKEMIDELNTTENPLWIEQKLKLYEEQELTMQVFSEPDQSGGIGIPPNDEGIHRRDSVDFSQMDAQSNTYATIQLPARRGSSTGLGPRLGDGNVGDSADYATLGRMPAAGRPHTPRGGTGYARHPSGGGASSGSSGGSYKGAPGEVYSELLDCHGGNPNEAGMGFQASTFLVPSQFDSSSRPHNSSKSPTVATVPMNEHGEPEFVAELI
ncbi:cadherin-87A-like [Ischnura elegans]|uniref:cadherin-87A-like n=1 Tax=Ischnura elegans TaxID=197161 RepID=UPI001ED86A09|nr:cadherin-87A-like [Ischnura elegans]XP_046393426.1 cadherin-87A-like [Ischnura elegans]